MMSTTSAAISRPISSITIELPGIPRGKGRPRFSTRGGFARAYTDEQTASYEGALRMAGAAAMAGRAPLDGPLHLSMIATFPIPASWSKKRKADAVIHRVLPTGKPDCDNLLKCIDGLNGIAFADDAQVTRVAIVKRYGEFPGMSIVISEIGSEA